MQRSDLSAKSNSVVIVQEWAGPQLIVNFELLLGGTEKGLKLVKLECLRV